MWLYEPEDDPDLFLQNWHSFYMEGLEFNVPQYRRIWEFVTEFVQDNNHVPTFPTLRDHFTNEDDLDVVDQLELLKLTTPRVKGDFTVYMKEKAEERRKAEVEDILQTANEININGLEVQEGKDKKILKGSRQALHYVINKAPDLLTPVRNSRLRGEVLRDVDNFAQEYMKAKSDPMQGAGYISGLKQMDEVTGGLRRYEMWTHAAFAGHCKTTLALNWMYNQAVYLGNNIYYYSLEMPYEQIRRILIAMHSYHEIFTPIRVELGLQDNPSRSTSLDYQFIRYGKLTEPQEEFLLKHVLTDLKDPNNGYGAFYVDTPDPSKDKTTIADIRASAELQHAQTSFAACVIDHLLLVSSRRWMSSPTDRLNEVCREAKWMALHFNRGEGVALLVLFQTNRDGFKHASTNNGEYQLIHLAQANEIERSSDTVSYSWLDDELSLQNRIQIGCLKTRDNSHFRTFRARMEWPCRRMLTCFDLDMYDPGSVEPIEDAELEAAQDFFSTDL
jgi:hypothetical protein